MSAPLITVLVTARDAQPYIAESLDSVRAQTVGDFELIVVDDGSRDKTPSIVERYAADDPRIALVRRESSGGPYVAANEGLRHASGRYLARLDADDIALPDRFERQLAFLRDRPGLRGCMGEVRQLIGDRLAPVAHREISTLPRAVKWGIATRAFFPSTALLETDAVREIGGYRELPASQDHRLWCDFARREWLGVMREVLVYWRRHERQLSTMRSDLQWSLGADVVAEHLTAVSGQTWSKHEADVLRCIGATRPVALGDGLRTLKRFERAWRADMSLSADDRNELTRLTRRLRGDHLREAARKSVSSLPLGRAALRTYTRVNVAVRSHR